LERCLVAGFTQTTTKKTYKQTKTEFEEEEEDEDEEENESTAAIGSSCALLVIQNLF
jgi:hypothetical protein